MARSYKHTPYMGQENLINKNGKRLNNHRVRQMLKDPEVDLSNMDYRKIAWSTKIHDRWWYAPYSFEQYYIDEVARLKMYEDTDNFGWDIDTDPPTRSRIWDKYNKLFKRK